MPRIALAAAVAATLLYAVPSLACGNSMREQELRISDPEQRALQLARASARRGDHAAALVQAERAAASKSYTLRRSARSAAVEAARNAGKHEVAAGHLEAMLQEQHDTHTSARLARVEVELERYQRARDRLEQMVTEDQMPGPDAWVTLALARRAQGEKEAALEAVEAALGSSPRHREARALKEELTGRRLAPQKGPAKKQPVSSRPLPGV